MGSIIASEIPSIAFSSPVTVSPNVNEYKLPNGCVGIPDVFLDGKSLIYVPADKFYTLSSSLGRPSYYTIVAGKLYLNPIPDSAYTLTLSYRDKLISADLTEMDSILLSGYALLCLEAGVLWLAYLKEDSEAYDIAKAMYYEQKFFSLLSLARAKHTSNNQVGVISPVHCGLL